MITPPLSFDAPLATTAFAPSRGGAFFNPAGRSLFFFAEFVCAPVCAFYAGGRNG